MSDGLQEKALNALIKVVTTLIAGTGAVQISGGELYDVMTRMENSACQPELCPQILSYVPKFVPKGGRTKR